MYLKSKALYIYTQSYTHTGSGSSLSAIDLPIQRERVTGFPIVYAGSLKGALRDVARSKYKIDALEAIFGPESPKYSSAIGVGDARILLFPVRSIKGVFAWTTCSLALERWARAMEGLHTIPTLPTTPVGYEPDGTPRCYSLSGLVDPNGYVVLEDVVFKNIPEPRENDRGIVSKFADWLAKLVFQGKPSWMDMLKNNLIILPNDEFTFFVSHATDVQTRNHLEPDTKIVRTGALWTEENLPEDTLMYAPIHSRRIMSQSQAPEVVIFRNDDPKIEAQNIIDDLQNNINGVIQIGGNETTGHGIIRLIWN